MQQSVFERYGGFVQVRRIVSAFYDKVIDSEVTGRHFDGIDMMRLIDHQTKFIASLMGGPAIYSDERLRLAHTRLGITREEFAEMALLLRETLEEFDLRDADIELVEREIWKREHCIVGPAEAPRLDVAEAS